METEKLKLKCNPHWEEGENKKNQKEVLLVAAGRIAMLGKRMR